MRWHPEEVAPPADAHPATAPQPVAAEAYAGLRLDDTAYRRAGWAIVLLGVLGFVLWAALAPLDKGVPASGTVQVAGNRQAVHSAVEGRIARIGVREGDAVQAGQTLVQLDDASVRAVADSLRSQLVRARATAARLAAERDGKSAIAFASDLTQASSDAQVQAALAAQRRLFVLRREAMHNELAAMRQALAGDEAELAGLHQTMAAGAAESNAAGARIAQLQRQAAQVKLLLAQRQQQHQAEVQAQLAEAQMQAEALGERLRAAEQALGHTAITAPATGTVVGLGAFSEGGFVRAGERLMSVLPSGLPLVVQAQVPVNLIDAVHAGLPVDLMFTAFNQNRTPQIPGRVTLVAADRTVDERSGAAYYAMEVAITPEGQRMLGGQTLRPGMPVEVFVRTGERSLASYLFKPLLDRSRTALGEE